jgi:pyruvate/2-oxoglutarate dehydrogenase complex dihydrolipoamide acyltransferase (E2) component
MHTPITLPELGAPHVVLSVWYVKPGETVTRGERLVEVLAGGATFDVVSPAPGRLAEHHAHPRDRLHAGQVLGMLESEG